MTTPLHYYPNETIHRLVETIDIWRKFTNLEPEKQGPAIALSLEGDAQDEILELDTPLIARTDGVDKITKRLNRLYKKMN